MRVRPFDPPSLADLPPKARIGYTWRLRRVISAIPEVSFS
jgi:hypothetical protein